MKKILALCLMTFTVIADAKWLEIDPSDSRGFSFFYDASSIIKRGDFATIKTLKNFKEPQNSVDPNKSYIFFSKTTLQEIDCSKNKYRNREISMWSKGGGEGKLEQTYIYGPDTSWGKWVKTTSIESIVIGKACRGV